ncbi:TadE/TadG family type IV pilus assembly protein [Agromyces albus]|uniref:TadE/TadG family type IV pilus assembly protein n=1 Tax=Agromyces albus TaxID=205332 RepID=UPI0027814B4A|nr:TadE family protein [Agromyces albus]MDQ0573783.1 Flp pilus assembly pilin Flp [Agromyces albus]
MTSVRSERGAAAVEFALILLPFLLIVSLVVDVGWVFSQQQAVTNAARIGARYYAIHHLEPSAQADAEQRANDVATAANVAGPITFSYPSTCARRAGLDAHDDCDRTDDELDRHDSGVRWIE